MQYLQENPKERNYIIAGTIAGVAIGFVSYACVLGVNDVRENGKPNMLAVLAFVAAGGVLGGVIGDRL